MNIPKNSNLVPVICKVQYQFIENVSSIIEGSTIYRKEVTFNSGQTWFDLFHAVSDISFEEPHIKNEGGTLYNQKLSLFFPGDDETNIESFYNFSGRKIILKLIYDNGISKIIGSRKNPAIAGCDFSLNNSMAGSQITFTCKSTDKAFILE